MRVIPSKLIAHWKLKLLAGSGISLGFFAGYFLLQHVHLFPVHVMPASPLDDMIGFHPGFMILYVSLWLYMSIVPWLTDERNALLRYVAAMGAISLFGLFIFLIWPTAVVRPAIESAADPLYRFLLRFDGTVNACPSLHVTFAVYSALCLDDFIRAIPRAWFLHLLNWMWCSGILYSTLATKQHVSVDVFCGIPVGTAAWMIFFWRKKVTAREIQ